MKPSIRSLLSALAAGALFASVSTAQDGQEELKRKLAEKLSHDFVAYGGWVTDYDEARERAKTEGKVLFVYFSRSYAP